MKWNLRLELEDEMMVDLAYVTALHESPSTLEFSLQMMVFACSDQISHVTLQVRFADEA